MTTTTITYRDAEDAAIRLAARWRDLAQVGQVDGVRQVAGVPRGGLVPAAMVAPLLSARLVSIEDADEHTLIVDDLIDSGATARRVAAERPFDALFRKPNSPPLVAMGAVERDGWLVFPWENDSEKAGPEDAVVRLLEHMGEDPNREGLLATPGRVLRAFTEMTAGYAQDPAAILSTVFDERHDQMVVLDGIEFTSTCEHHLLPFVGTAVVGYVPRQRVVGLSKLARLVECYARRLQVQERMTEQIASALMEHLNPEGAGVVIRAHHSCMGCRGVRKPSARMTTSALHGIMRHSGEARAEFLAFARNGHS